MYRTRLSQDLGSQNWGPDDELQPQPAMPALRTIRQSVDFRGQPASVVTAEHAGDDEPSKPRRSIDLWKRIQQRDALNAAELFAVRRYGFWRTLRSNWLMYIPPPMNPPFQSSSHCKCCHGSGVQTRPTDGLRVTCPACSGSGQSSAPLFPRPDYSGPWCGGRVDGSVVGGASWKVTC